MDAANCLSKFLRQLHFRAERTQIRRAGFAFDPPIEKIAGAGHQLFKFFPAAFPHHRIGIFACRHFGDANDEIVLEKRVERTLGCFLPGRIGVEAENDFADEPLQDPRLLFGEGRPLRRDDIRDPRFEQRDEVELSFANDRTVRFDQSPLGFVQTKQDAAFPEERRLGRVHVFRCFGLLIENPAAERDYFADVVVNRKHDPVPEPVVTLAVASALFAPCDEPAFQKQPLLIPTLERPTEKCIPAFRREPDPPILRDPLVDPPPFQIFSRRFADFFLHQVLVKPFRRFGVQLEQRPPRFMLPVLLSGARTALLDHRNANACRELLHRRGEFEMLVIHHEPKNASARAAAEAMECLPRRTHRERRRLLLMKRTDRLEGRAGALERKISPDHLHDVVRGRDLLDGL